MGIRKEFLSHDDSFKKGRWLLHESIREASNVLSLPS